jgi:hypothetical protein
MQGGLSCCFNRCQLCCPSAAALFGELLPQHGRTIWLNAALCSRDQLRDPPSAVLGGWPVVPPLLSAFVLFLISDECWWLLWEVNLLPHSLFQTLCLSQSLLGACGSSWGLAYRPSLLSAFAALSACHGEFSSDSLGPYHNSDSSALRVHLFAPTPILWGGFSFPSPPPLSVLDYKLLFMFFSFAVWGSSVYCCFQCSVV